METSRRELPAPQKAITQAKVGLHQIRAVFAALRQGEDFRRELMRLIAAPAQKIKSPQSLSHVETLARISDATTNLACANESSFDFRRGISVNGHQRATKGQL